MQTYSHLIITAALNHSYNKNKNDNQSLKVDKWALLLGSFAPDMPLVILTGIFFIQKFFLGDASPADGIFGVEYDNLYFNDPIWITGHALFHAPPMLALYLTIGYWVGFKHDKQWARSLFWFAIGCALHSAIDIVTHHNDGPLLFFPFDWKTRFSSPVSYWDPNHYGGIFAPLEHVLDIILIVWMVMTRQMPKSKQKEKKQSDLL